MMTRSLAFITLILFSPIIIFVAIIIVASDGSPIFYKQKRIGKNNRHFYLHKFRTMKNNTPEVSTDLLKDPENYYIKFGMILRRFSIDEIPQLLNIIKGEMNFIGPRPAYYKQYKLIEMRTENNIHKLKPGITGWAQINGRDQISDNTKVELDKYYLLNKNIVLDVKILFYTIFKVILHKDLRE